MIISIVLSLIIGFIIGFVVARIIPRMNKSTEALPSQTKIAENHLESKLEEKIYLEEEISFISNLNEKISLSLDRNEIARNIVEEVNRFLNTQKCVLLLLDKDAEALRINYAIGVSKDAIKNYLFKKGESISGWVLVNNEPLIVVDPDKESWFKKINREEYLKGSFICVPLSIKDEVFGVLNVCDKKTNQPFKKEDLIFLTNVARVGAIAFQNIRLREEIQEGYLKTITSLALAIDAKDPYTKRHSENVTKYSLAIAKEIGLNTAETELLRRAGLLHDIGKIGIKDEILFKFGKLTLEEFAEIKLHPVKGEMIVKSLPFLKEVSILIRHHHERYDGRGYPDGINGNKIELGASILAVADSLEAMISDRPYRKRLSLESAIEELKRGKATQFNPIVVDNFLKILQQNPDIVQQ